MIWEHVTRDRIIWGRNKPRSNHRPPNYLQCFVLFNFELIQFSGVDREQKEELVTPSNSPSTLKQGGGKKADHTKRVCGVATKTNSLQERKGTWYLSIHRDQRRSSEGDQ